MRFHRLSKLLLVLLLAASLPLRVYAASCESPGSHAGHPVTHAGHTAVRHGTHCEHGSLSAHCAACDCCCMAVAAGASMWAPPHDPAAAVIARLLGHSPVLTLDRLDRPPRLPA